MLTSAAIRMATAQFAPSPIAHTIAAAASPVHAEAEGIEVRVPAATIFTSEMPARCTSRTASSAWSCTSPFRCVQASERREWLLVIGVLASVDAYVGSIVFVPAAMATGLRLPCRARPADHTRYATAMPLGSNWTARCDRFTQRAARARRAQELLRLRGNSYIAACLR